ncbi:MAG: DnaJ C-terminal domain-containing protein [Streptosporangiaceae bacterium]
MTGGAGGPAGSPDFSDMFDGVFGRPADGPQPGRDVTVGLELAAAEVARGVTKTIVVPMLVECAACAASGAVRGSRQVRCPVCGGDGRSRRAGRGVTQQMCLPCRGTGEVPSDPCPECQGKGRSAGERTVRVAFPAGVSYGARLRVPGQGGAALPGGQPGDLYVQAGMPPGERPTMPGPVLIRNPASRTIARLILAGAWLLFGLYLTLSGPACPAYAGPAASCQAASARSTAFCCW